MAYGVFLNFKELAQSLSGEDIIFIKGRATKEHHFFQVAARQPSANTKIEGYYIYKKQKDSH